MTRMNYPLYETTEFENIRIMVENEKISDNDAVLLCKDIIKKIEAELAYPGQIKVTVIRETRVSDYAR